MSTLLQYLDEAEQEVAQWPSWKRESIKAAFFPTTNTQKSTQIKRAQFAKDLDKLISGDYVLVPKEPTVLMEKAGMEAGAGFLATAIFKAMVVAAQEASL